MLCLPLLLLLPVVSLRGIHAVFYNGSRRDLRHGSCRLRTVRQIADPPIGPPTIESFVFDDIEYKLCRYHVTWDEALVFCSSQKAHLATLDTEEKAAFVVRAIASGTSVSEDYWVGARKYHRGSWTWNSNQRKLSSERDIIGRVPLWYPGYESNDVRCLTIDRSGHDVPIFVSQACDQRRPFICQRDNERTVDNKIRMVAAWRIGDQEFRLYSARATWAEAVVQCRQEGLQIGEVNTVEEARALAVFMLRNRPVGIESAWIGGYTRKDDPSTWRWLASGKKIENNDMWRKNLTEYAGDCLLLDRHVCESPVYVETMCDRKRDVLCQKPPKKRVSKYPFAVFVDGCPYWIGFNPLKWFDAKQSCDAMNASLVVLNSPETIAHMMRLMLDNRAELRHIWTDGSRVRNADDWRWDSTGERIPDFGESFIPWCPNDDYYSDERECLNLDRENLDTPLIYGLSCREKQPYVCQPRIGDCVFHSTPTTTSTPRDATEDISKSITAFTTAFYEDSGPLPLSKVTAPYPAAANDNYVAIQTTIDHENNHLKELLSWKTSESVSEKNSSTDNLHSSWYLKPLSRFTLPSLPQFGIKVVSAAETPSSSRPTMDGKRNKMKTYQATGSSLYAVTPSILASTTLPIFTTSRKVPVETYRKASKWLAKSTNVSVTSNLSGYIESTASSVPMSSTAANVFSKIPNASNAKLLYSGSRNSNLNSTKAVQVATTSASLLPEDPSLPSTLEDDRAKKYSVKTTRDLNPSNSTRIDLAITTKTPETIKDKPTYSFQRNGGVSGLKDFKDTQPKPVVVESFPVNAARPNTTLVVRRKPIVRTTTEATPYDAIDADYYNNYEAPEKSSKGKVTTDEESRDGGTGSNEYPEDYESVTPVKLQTKKKTKQTSTSGIRKSDTTMKSFRRMKVPKVDKAVEEIDEDEEETDEETEDNDETTTPANGKSVPIAAQLSKNLEAALVNMMRQSAEKRKNEKADSGIMLKSAGQREANVSSVGRSTTGLKTMDTENWSLRPYYAFEGPMIVGLSEDSNLGGEVERTGEKGSGKVREFKFIGKKMNENPSTNGLEMDKFIVNETRRQMTSQADVASNGSPGNNNMAGVSMSGLDSGGRQNVERPVGVDRKPSIADNMREDRLTSDQRRYGMSGPNARPRQRYRPRPGSREDELRRNGHPGAWEKQRRPSQESDSSYYEGRRLYPRGYDLYESSMPRHSERRNEERRREAQERLSVAWPDRNYSNLETFGFEERSRVVSPRTFPAPTRTTRSFHEDHAIRRAEPARLRPFPDFRLSKLVKEVKIDLDQRLLRKYLEGFARRIAREDVAREDDWRSTWRRLLAQMLTVLDRMNINVNGDVVKVRVGSDERENKLTPSSSIGRSRTLDWKSGLRKQRKNPANSGSLKHSSNPVARKINGSATAEDTKLPSAGQYRRVSPNSLEDKDRAKMKDSKLVEGQTTDSYRRYAYGDSLAKSPVAEKIIEREKIVGGPRKSSLPEINILTAMNRQNAGGSIYVNKFVDNPSKTFPRREERTARPTVDHQFAPRQIGNDLQRANWFQPKYTNFNSSPIAVLAPAPSMIPRISTVFGYQPVMPQLHHRILFPGWTGIRVLDQVNPAATKSAVLKGEYLPRGTLSRIVGSEHKNEHFGDRSDQNAKSPGKHDSGASTTARPGMNDNNVSTSPEDSFDRKMGPKLENESPKKNNLLANNPADNGSGTDNGKNEAWRRVGGYVGGNEVPNGDTSRYYEHERYLNESGIRKMDNDREEFPDDRDLGEEDITDEDTDPRDDYEQKPVWTPAHHLTKALELSLLRKFGTNPANSLRSKNLVARSTKNSEVGRYESHGESSDYVRRPEIEDDLERLNEEPSIVSLRMTMDPEKKASPRTSRQSEGSQVLERKPRTVELRVQFSGKEETANTVTERINEVDRLSSDVQRNSRNNRTSHRSSMIDQDLLNLRATKRRPRVFIDKDRRRALMNRLGERSHSFRLNYPRSSYPWHGRNGTVINNPRDKLATGFLSPRDRKSRTIGAGGKNLANHENSSQDYPAVKHHIASIIRSFDEKNFTRKEEQDKWRRGGPYGKKFGVDWTGQAASLFTDLKESSDEFTLYIDLTLGRVGSKTRNKGRSRG